MIGWFRSRRRGTGDPADCDLGDARRVSGRTRRRELDPESRRSLKLRQRALVLGLSGACLAGTLAAFIGEGGYLDLSRLRDEIAEIEADCEAHRGEIASLALEVQQLEGGSLLRERVAREQLGLVRPGEVDFLLPREVEADWDAPPPTSAGQP